MRVRISQPAAPDLVPHYFPAKNRNIRRQTLDDPGTKAGSGDQKLAQATKWERHRVM
jgi:hypothetical protein